MGSNNNNNNNTTTTTTSVDDDRIPITSARATEYTTVGNTLMPMSRPLPRRLLGVWAHPDDEAYLSAGLMARVIEAGGEVTVLTATRGEKGTDDPADYDQPHFAAHRERELRAALGEIGVTDVRFMGLLDGECDITDDAGAVGAIAATIADVRPDTIVTFGPDGITNHDDHRAVSRWTTEAWRRSADGELLYATMSNEFIAAHRDLHDRLGIFAEFGDGRPTSVSRRDIALECALTEVELDRKRRSLAAHSSQTDGLAALMGEDVYRTWWSHEHFRRPTRSEIDRCPVPVWMEQAARLQNERELELVGS